MGATCGTGSRCPCSNQYSTGIGEEKPGHPHNFVREEELAIKTLGGGDDLTWRGDWCSCSAPPKVAETGASGAPMMPPEKQCKSDASGISTREASVSNVSEPEAPPNREIIPGFAAALGRSPPAAASASPPAVSEECATPLRDTDRYGLSKDPVSDKSLETANSHSPGSRCRMSQRILDPLTHSMSMLAKGSARKSKCQGGRSKEEDVLRPPSGNANRPGEYAWLQSTMESMVRNEAASLGCKDLSNDKEFIPIFVVMGGCPNMFCGMQAVMYCVSKEGEVDFWWVKPDKQGAMERETLNRHGKGTHKNDPGRSKPFYKPLADLFGGLEVSMRPGTSFGIERINSSDGSSIKTSRAFIDQDVDGRTERFYVYAVWQEDWSSGMFSKKYIKGKILYQKDPESNEYYSRQYNIANNQLTLMEREDPPFTDVLPGDDIKELRGLD